MNRADRLRWLDTFIRIVERGSISAAARDLNLSQASASRQLAQLEDNLGVTLILRSTHALSLTEAGERMLPKARALLAGWDSLLDETSADGPLKGPIRAIVPIALGQTILLPAMVTFMKTHPEIRLNWMLRDRDIRFSEEGCDVWINIGRPADDSLICREVAQVQRLLVASPNFEPVSSPERLKAYSFVGLGPFEGTQLPLTDSSGDVETLRLDATLLTDSIMAAKQAALDGLGFAVMPRWLVADALASGALINILPNWNAPSLPITLNYAPATRTVRRMVAFRDAMETAITEAIRPSSSGG